MAFVYRSEKHDASPPAETRKSPIKSLGNGRDILSQIVVELFPKKTEQKKLLGAKSHDQTFITPPENRWMGVNKPLEKQSDSQLLRKENLSSFFKSITKRSVLGEIICDTNPNQPGKKNESESLHINGRHLEAKEIQTQTYEQESTMMTFDKVNNSKLEKTVGEFQRILFNLNDSTGGSESNHQRMFPMEVSYSPKHQELQQSLTKKKGIDFSKSKVKRQVFKPKQTYQSIIDDQKYSIPKKHKATKKVARQQKITTASTANTRIWGDESESEEDEYEVETTPGPGYYQPNYNTQFSSCKQVQIYKNKEPKYKSNEKENSDLGPTSYNGDYSSFQYKGSYLSRCERFEVGKEKGYGAEIGLYNPRSGIESSLIKKILKDPIGNFGGNSLRFRELYQNKKIPGPGEYEVKREFDDSKENSKGQSMSMLLNQISTSNENKPGPGTYHLKSDFDPYKNEFQSLFKASPCFGSSSPKFQKPPKCERQQSFSRFQLRQQQKQKAYVAPSFKPFNIGIDRFIPQKRIQAPQTGEYYNSIQETKQWNKKSFNILFQANQI